MEDRVERMWSKADKAAAHHSGGRLARCGLFDNNIWCAASDGLDVTSGKKQGIILMLATF